MIVIILSILLFLIFLAMGAIHFYWFFGGFWGLSKVIPTRSNVKSNMKIPKEATLMVGIILILLGFIFLIKLNFFTTPLPLWFLKYSYWFIATIFIMRAIGEFKYVGFFKIIKDTEFARADSKLFTPLCTAIGLTVLLLELLN